MKALKELPPGFTCFFLSWGRTVKNVKQKVDQPKYCITKSRRTNIIATKAHTRRRKSSRGALGYRWNDVQGVGRILGSERRADVLGHLCYL